MSRGLIIVDVCRCCGSDLVVINGNKTVLCVDCRQVDIPVTLRFAAVRQKWVEFDVDYEGKVVVECPECGVRFRAEQRWGHATCPATLCTATFSIVKNLA